MLEKDRKKVLCVESHKKKVDDIVVGTEESKLNDAEKVNIFSLTFCKLARFCSHTTTWWQVNMLRKERGNIFPLHLLIEESYFHHVFNEDITQFELFININKSDTEIYLLPCSSEDWLPWRLVCIWNLSANRNNKNLNMYLVFCYN